MRRKKKRTFFLEIPTTFDGGTYLLLIYYYYHHYYYYTYTWLKTYDGFFIYLCTYFLVARAINKRTRHGETYNRRPRNRVWWSARSTSGNGRIAINVMARGLRATVISAKHTHTHSYSSYTECRALGRRVCRAEGGGARISPVVFTRWRCRCYYWF